MSRPRKGQCGSDSLPEPPDCSAIFEFDGEAFPGRRASIPKIQRIQTTVNNTYRYAPSVAGIGWIFSLLSGIQGNGSAWGAAPAPNGTQTAFIQSNGSISQALPLNAGTDTLTLQAAHRFCGEMPCAQQIRITLDGIQVGSLVSPASTSFSPFSVTFSVATSGAHTIAFAGTQVSDGIVFVDNVTLRAGP